MSASGTKDDFARRPRAEQDEADGGCKYNRCQQKCSNNEESQRQYPDEIGGDRDTMSWTLQVRVVLDCPEPRTQDGHRVGDAARLGQGTAAGESQIRLGLPL